MATTLRTATLLAAALILVAPLEAQIPDSTVQRQQRALDSLAAIVRALQARIAALESRRAAGDTSGGDELAALRAAAAAATADTSASAARPQQARLGQNALNPEITVTGDLRGSAFSPGPQQDNFTIREWEFGFQSALDPYASAKIFLSVAGEEVGVEEGYMYFPALPGHLRLDVGRFRQQVGELNRWHLHALPGDNYPLVLRRYAGDEGVTGTGVSVYWPLPVSAGTWELTTQVTAGGNEILYGGGSRPNVTAQLAAFWQLSRSTYLMTSVTGAMGSNPDAVSPADTTLMGLKTRLGVVAARFTWAPPGRAQERQLTLRGEVWNLQRKYAGLGGARTGWFADGSLRLNRRLIAGLRYDRVANPDSAAVIHEWAITPALTYWQSEFVYLRALYEHSRDIAGANKGRFTIQAVFAMGPHKHELF